MANDGEFPGFQLASRSWHGPQLAIEFAHCKEGRTGQCDPLGWLLGSAALDTS